MSQKFEDKNIVFDYEDDVSIDDLFSHDSPTSSFNLPEELNRHIRYKILDLKAENGSLRRALGETEEKLQKELHCQSEGEYVIKNDLKVDELKILQEKLAQTNARLYESKNACLSLRQELNKAQKLLQSEVGDNVSIASLSNYPGGWKGRAEQILQLQQKITELQSKNEVGRASRSSSITFDKRSIMRTNSIDQKRRQQVDVLGRELKQAEVVLEERKRKLEASKARIKVLENDLNTAKRNFIILNEKRVHDDQLIEALNGQLRAVEGRYREREVDIKSQKDKLERDYDNLKKELNCSRLQVEQLRKKLHEREIEIDTLKHTSDKSSILGNKSDDFYRVASNKTLHDCPMNTERSLKNPNEYVILGLAAEAERERLMELVALLNRRLDKERTDTDNVSELLRKERCKSLKLEKKLERLESAGIIRPKVNSGYRSRGSKLSINSVSSKEEINIEQIHYKLELLEEECLALKARLATVQQEKTSDFTTYRQMLEQTKKIFQENLREKTSVSGANSMS